MERIIIYAKDIQILTGRSERYCRDLMRKIREANNKLPNQLVTVTECSRYMNIPREELIHACKRSYSH